MNIPRNDTSYLCAKAAKCLDKDCSLSIDVGASHYPRLLQWLVFLGLVPANVVQTKLRFLKYKPKGHDARHFLLCNLNLPAAVHVRGDLTHAEVRASLAVRL